MHLPPQIMRFAYFWLFLLIPFLQGFAATVYFDNATKKWATPHIHYWGGSSASSYPGVPMSLTESGSSIWKYEVPDNTTGLLFNAGDGDASKIGDFNFNAGHVYNENGDSGKTLEQYTAGEPDPPGTAVTIWADVPSSWTNMKAYVYLDGGAVMATWPGKEMTKDPTTGYWSLSIPAAYSNGLAIFYSSDNNRYPGNNVPGLPIGAKDMIYRQNGNKWEEYTGGTPTPPDPVETEYKIYFHNKDNYDKVCVRIWDANDGNKSYTASGIGDEMFRDINISYLQHSFICTNAKPDLKCVFYYGPDSSSGQTTSTFPLVNEHVYTYTRDGGPISTYDPEYVEKREYWLEPEKPTQLQKATLYFDRSFNSSGKLKNTDDIYVWTWMPLKGGSEIAPSCKWESPDSKYKMTREGNSDIFSLSFDPSIQDWYGLDTDARGTKIGVIFRDKSGNNKQHDSDIFFDLKPIADPVVDPSNSNLGSFVSYTDSEGTVTVTGTRGTLQITPWAPQVIKVFTLKNGATATTERRSISVVDKHDDLLRYDIPEAHYSVSESDDWLTLNVANGPEVRVSKATCLMTFSDEEGTEMLTESTGLVNSTSGGNSKVGFAGMMDDAFYGGGYNGNWLNWEGNSMIMNNTQTGNWGVGTKPPHNICVPFYVSTSGYGVYFDDHWRGASVTPSAGGSTYQSGSKDPIAYYYIGGGTLEAVLENYSLLTGRQDMPPYWAMGYISSKFSFASEQEARQNVQKHKEANIPMDGIVFDIHWQGGVSKMGRLDWDTSLYPSGGQKIMADFKAQNIHTIAITEPYFTANSGNYQYPKNQGYFSASTMTGMGWLNSGENVGMIDTSNPAAMDWMYTFYKARTQEGMDGHWLDLGEPEKHPESNCSHMGGSCSQIHNEFGNLWIEAVYRRLRRDFPGQRHILLPRAGTAGMQRFSTFPWTGDIARSWGGLQAQVPALVNASMSGIGFLGSDIGGFINHGLDAQLYMRWMQLAVFYPVMRTHSAESPEPWQSCYASKLEQIRNAANMRYKYLPYSYSQAAAYSRYGTPMARPASDLDPYNTNLNNSVDSYMWGPDIFVAPIMTNGSSRDISFPPGDWLDLSDLTSVYSGTTRGYNAPDKLPCFMRRGSFVTTYSQDTFTSTAEIDRGSLTIDYFATKDDALDGSVLYDDDHESPDPVGQGRYLNTILQSYNDNGGLLIHFEREGTGWEGMPEIHNILLRVHDYELPESDFNVKIHHHGPANPTQKPGMFREQTSNILPLDQKSGLAEVENSSEPGFASENGKTYVRLNIDPTHKYGLYLATPDVLTGVENLVSGGTMSLAFDGEHLLYTLPAESTGTMVEIFTATGTRVLAVPGLTADGHTHSLEADLEAGIYIARLTATDATGRTRTTQAKAIVK